MHLVDLERQLAQHNSSPPGSEVQFSRLPQTAVSGRRSLSCFVFKWFRMTTNYLCVVERVLEPIIFVRSKVINRFCLAGNPVFIHQSCFFVGHVLFSKVIEFARAIATSKSSRADAYPKRTLRDELKKNADELARS